MAIWHACIIGDCETPRQRIHALPFGIEAVSYHEAVGKAEVVRRRLAGLYPDWYWFSCVNDSTRANGLIDDPETCDLSETEVPVESVRGIPPCRKNSGQEVQGGESEKG